MKFKNSLPVRLCLLLIILVSIALYFPSLTNEFILGDDYDQIVNHPLVHELKFLPSIFKGSTYFQAAIAGSGSYGPYYRPLMLAVFNIIYHFVGVDPLYYHLVQIIFHTLNGILIFFLFKFFLKANNLSLVGALIFIVHPINSETVLFSGNLQDVLFVFFGLLGFYLTLLNYYQKSFLHRLLLASCFFLSLMSKETGILFFAISLLYVIIYQHTSKIKITLLLLLSLLPYLYLRFVIAALPIQSQLIDSLLSSSPLIQKFYTLPQIVSTYLLTFFYPLNLSIHQSWIVKAPSQTNFFLPLLFVLTFITLFIRLKVPLIFKLWFIIGVSLHLHLILPLSSTVAERWFYFPAIGLIAALFYLLKNISWKILLLPVIIIILSLSIKTHSRINDWQDSKTLFTSDLNKYPLDYYLKNLLASVYLNEKDYQKAKPLIEQSVKEYPFFGNLNNLALVYIHANDFNSAEKAFSHVLTLGPNYQAFVNYLNFLYYLKKDYVLSKEIADRGLKLYPKGGDIYLVKAQLEYRLGNQAAASNSASLAHLYMNQPISHAIWEIIKTNKPLVVDQLLSSD